MTTSMQPPRTRERLKKILRLGAILAAVPVALVVIILVGEVFFLGTARLSQKRLLRQDLEELSSAPPPASMNAPPEKPTSWITVPVYYGTRRARTRASDIEHYYSDRDDTLKYGIATITIPERRRPGKTDGRGWCRFLPGKLECPRTPSNSVLLSALKPRRPAAWLREVGVALIDSNDKPVDALIFVHGYNNSFVDAITRAAQLSYDAGFPGVTFAYDWASRDALPAYFIDQETAERSAPDFSRFLRRIVDSTQARRVAIVAHSMGTRLVLYALRDLEEGQPLTKLDQIILAASDVDSAIFMDQYAGRIVQTAGLATIYASKRDRALLISGPAHGAHRVGSGPPTLVLYDGLDYIDASTIDTDLLGHGYYAENKQLIDDIFLILRHGFPASYRNLSRIGEGPLSYYRFR